MTTCFDLAKTLATKGGEICLSWLRKKNVVASNGGVHEALLKALKE